MNFKIIKRVNLGVSLIGILWLSSLYLMETLFKANCLIGTIGICPPVHEVLAHATGVWVFFLFIFSVFNLLFYFLYDQLYKIWTYFSYVSIPVLSLIVSFSSTTNGGFVGPSDAALFFFIGAVFYVVSSVLMVGIGIPVILYKRRK